MFLFKISVTVFLIVVSVRDVREARLDYKAKIPLISKCTRLKMLLLRLGFFTCGVAVNPTETFVHFPLLREPQSFETELAT